jgi:hypothetical protein
MHGQVTAGVGKRAAFTRQGRDGLAGRPDHLGQVHLEHRVGDAADGGGQSDGSVLEHRANPRDRYPEDVLHPGQVFEYQAGKCLHLLVIPAEAENLPVAQLCGADVQQTARHGASRRDRLDRGGAGRHRRRQGAIVVQRTGDEGPLHHRDGPGSPLTAEVTRPLQGADDVARDVRQQDVGGQRRLHRPVHQHVELYFAAVAVGSFEQNRVPDGVGRSAAPGLVQLLDRVDHCPRLLWSGLA